MTHPIRKGLAGAAVAAIALPAAALGQGHGDRGGKLPARVKHRIDRVERALDKALDAIDDGDNATAIAKLATVDKNLGKAVTAAKTDKALGAVAAAADDVATSAAVALDGAGQELSDALVTTLDGALDDRDTIVGSVESGGVLERIASDSDDEAEAFTEGAAEDELVDSAKAAETAAADQATQTAATARAAGDATDEDTSDEHEHGDCPGHGGPHGPGGPQGGPTGPTGPTGSQGSVRNHL